MSESEDNEPENNNEYISRSQTNLVNIPAWDLIANKCLESEDKVTIFVLGPCTNVANALIKYPEIKDKINKLIFMGGGIREGAAGQCASVNVFHDPEAFRYLVRSGVPFYMCTAQEMTSFTSISPLEAKEMFGDKNELCKVVCNFIDFYHSSTNAFGESINSRVILHDPACILYALEEDKYEVKKVFCDIELTGQYSKGLTVIDVNNRYNLKENEKNIYLVYAKKEYEEHYRTMFINGILNAL